MVENDANEWLFRVDFLPFNANSGIYLTYIENDNLGMKMTGGIPFLWDFGGKDLKGPRLYDDNHIYKVVNVDYQNNLIWLIQE